MNSLTNFCDADHLEAFLQGDLNDDEERELTAHLDKCSECRQRLEQRAAEPSSWDEARQLLKPQAFDRQCAAEGSRADHGRHARPSLQIQNVIDALDPTDDPEMLGRLGGYEVSGVVGAGGMGVVLKGFDKSLDRTVAIKVLAPHLASSGAARKRFAREAKAAAAVLHPNVMAIHSVSNDESSPFLVMPYSRGTSLQKRLDEDGPLPIDEVLRIGSQIASGLAAAHTQGLVHRDIKPANILLEDGVERVAITDFGLARAVDDATMSRSGVIAGTPQYMSPEQARGDTVDQRSDLFSLGSVLYALCTGRPPFRAETTYGVLRRITDEDPKPIREVNPDLPEWLCRIIMTLMAKQPADRFASAGQLAALLEDCLAHVQHPTAVSLPAIVAPHSANRRSSSRFRPSRGVIAMTVGIGLALFGMFLWQSTATPPDRPLPDGLSERLASLEGRFAIPSNASVKEFEDRYEISAAPWRTSTTLVDGKIASRAHDDHDTHKPDHKHDHSHDADHEHDHSHAADHTHKLTKSEYFADEGKLTVRKGDEGAITCELVGNTWFEGPDFNYSAQRVVFDFGSKPLGFKDAQMILTGNARLVNNHEEVHLSADKITYKAEWVLLEENARRRRKAPTGRTEIISADRLEWNIATGTIKAN